MSGDFTVRKRVYYRIMLPLIQADRVRAYYDGQRGVIVYHTRGWALP